MPQPLNSHPTLVGCPDCAGVLSGRADNGHREYECQIGHRYSVLSASAAKEQQLERVLWEALSLLEHLDILMGDILTDAASQESARLLVEAKRRQLEVQRQSKQLRQFIEESQPIAVEEQVPQ
jgi:hypothetical protein